MGKGKSLILQDAVVPFPELHCDAVVTKSRYLTIGNSLHVEVRICNDPTFFSNF